jgi:hypothetical protein
MRRGFGARKLSLLPHYGYCARLMSRCRFDRRFRYLTNCLSRLPSRHRDHRRAHRFLILGVTLGLAIDEPHNNVALRAAAVRGTRHVDCHKQMIEQRRRLRARCPKVFVREVFGIGAECSARAFRLAWSQAFMQASTASSTSYIPIMSLMLAPPAERSISPPLRLSRRDVEQHR